MHKIIRILLVITAAAMMLVAGAFAYLQTAAGQAWLTATIIKLAPDISITGLEGQIPTDMRVAHVAVSDAQGVWLEADELHVAWRPFALLHGKWDIEALEAANIHVLRQPVPAKNTSSGAFALPSLPDITLKSLSVPRIALDVPVTGQAQLFMVSGHASAGSYDFLGKTVEGPETSLNLHIAPDNSIEAGFREVPAGVVGTLLKLPGNVGLNAHVRVAQQKGVLQLSQLQAEIGQAKVTGNGSFNPGDQSLAANIAFTVPDLTEFSTTQGDADATVALQGTLPQLHFAVDAKGLANGQAFSLNLPGVYSGQNVSVTAAKVAYGPYHMNGSGEADVKAQTFKASLALENLPLQHFVAGREGGITAKLDVGGGFAAFTGTLQGDVVSGKGHFALNSPIHYDSKAVAFENLSLKGEGISAKGRVAWLLKQAQAEAKLALTASDIRPLGALLNVTLAGQARADLVLKPGEKQTGSMELEAKSLVAGSLAFNRLSLQASGDEHRFLAQASANGAASGKPLSFNFAAAGTRGVDENTLVIKTLSGAFAGEPFKLDTPATLLQSANKTEIKPAHLSLAGGSIGIKGVLTANSVAATLSARNLALEKIPATSLPPGSVNASLVLSGPAAAPKAVLHTTGNIRASEIPLNFMADGQWQGKALSVNAAVDSGKNKLGSAKLALVAPFSLSPVTLGVSGDTPVHGSLTLDAPLTLLNSVLYAQGMRTDGTLAGQANVSGTVGAPLVKGTFTLANMRFDHPDSGVCLRGTHAKIAINGEHIVLTDLSASAPKGTLNAHANIELAGDTVDGAVAFSHFPLFCGGTAKGLLDGHLAATGSLSSVHLAGMLTLGPLNVQLPGTTPGRMEIPQVKTVMVKPNEKNAPKPAAPATLDIVLDAPGQIFVRGRGLDAEFSGKLAMSGPVNHAAFEGTFKSTHGTFSLLDHELTLTDAAIRFDGPIPPSPFLDINAQTTVETTTIQVQLTGDAQHPTFVFTSTPALPQDEILALLLFGRSLSTLTPFQAIQLAQSVAELSGKSSGPGVLGKLRGALGVDRLDVGTGTDNSVTVGAGKYINSKVYVGVSQGANPEDRKVNTEIELTPQVSATSSIDALGNQGVGLQWKYDY